MTSPLSPCPAETWVAVTSPALRRCGLRAAQLYEGYLRAGGSMPLVVFEAVIAGRAASPAQHRLVAATLERHLREHPGHLLDADQHLPAGGGHRVDLLLAR